MFMMYALVRFKLERGLLMLYVHHYYPSVDFKLGRLANNQ